MFNAHLCTTRAVTYHSSQVGTRSLYSTVVLQPSYGIVLLYTYITRLSSKASLFFPFDSAQFRSLSYHDPPSHQSVMFGPQPSRMLLRTATAAARRPMKLTTASPWARMQLRFATQDYGSGDGNPAGEKPREQGQRGREDLEHPGPPPPKAAKNKSGSSSSPSSSADSKSGSSGDSGNGKAASKKESSDSDSSTSKGTAKGNGKPRPKILDSDAPTKGEEQSEDVKQHNREMEQRAERAHEQASGEDVEKDKVSKEFWSGESSSFFFAVFMGFFLSLTVFFG